MDHDELVGGGRGILDGKGDLGEILFAAGAGLARFDQVRKSLDEETEKLFKPTGKNPAINSTLAELKVARDLENKSMLPTQDWVDLHADLASGERSPRSGRLEDPLDRGEQARVREPAEGPARRP